MRKRLYVGYRRPDRVREIIRASSAPTEESHGATYWYAVGPFRTLRAASLCVSGDVPYQVSCVAEFEDYARRMVGAA